MCTFYFKLMIAVGLGMTLAGLVLMIESKILRRGEKKFDSHTVIRPVLYKVAWGLTVTGYVFQIIGVFAI
jgi:hypothetical protein